MQMSIRGFKGFMKQIVSAVQHGEEVSIYLRKKPIAKIVSILKSFKIVQEDYGFGMWRDSKEMSDVSGYLRRLLRKGRK